MASDLSDILAQAAAEPQSASNDGQSVSSRSLKDLIDLERYMAAKAAAANPLRGLRMTRLVKPGASPIDCGAAGSGTSVYFNRNL